MLSSVSVSVLYKYFSSTLIFKSPPALQFLKTLVCHHKSSSINGLFLVAFAALTHSKSFNNKGFSQGPDLLSLPRCQIAVCSTPDGYTGTCRAERVNNSQLLIQHDTRFIGVREKPHAQVPVLAWDGGTMAQVHFGGYGCQVDNITLKQAATLIPAMPRRTSWLLVVPSLRGLRS